MEEEVEPEDVQTSLDDLLPADLTLPGDNEVGDIANVSSSCVELL